MLARKTAAEMNNARPLSGRRARFMGESVQARVILASWFCNHYRVPLHRLTRDEEGRKQCQRHAAI